MFYTKDHKTGYLFDHGPFNWLGPKRTKLISQSWAMFRDKILPNFPVDKLRKYYHRSMGAPTKEPAANRGLWYSSRCMILLMKKLSISMPLIFSGTMP